MPSGKKKVVECKNVFEHKKGDAKFPISINYTDIETGGKYFVNDPAVNLIENNVADEYLSVLENAPSWNGSSGCWNWTGTGASSTRVPPDSSRKTSGSRGTSLSTRV